MENYNQTGCGCGRSMRNPAGPSGTRRFSRPMQENPGGRRGPAHPACSDAEEFPIGMAYVPWQTFRDLYCYEKALCVGSIFQELDKPFVIGRCAR